MSLPLEGCRVIVTRERPGELAALLTRRGASVVHLPLITVVDPVDGGAELRDALARLTDFDWLVVTSTAGAERVGAAARTAEHLRLAAVGSATASELRRASGRDVDLVPRTQRADGLAAAFVSREHSRQRILIAQADIAAPTLADALRAAGHEVTTVVAYRTVVVEPDAETRLRAAEVDAVCFASGSAVEGWRRAFGERTPPLVVAIGPSTAEAAARSGLKVSGVAADHSLEGLVTELEQQWVGAETAREER
jgi:uroporphyrinogen-III synthase